MKSFAQLVTVGRLVRCSFGGGASLWIWVLLMINLLGSDVGAELSPDGQALLKFLEDNVESLDNSLEQSFGFSSWNASEDTPCEWAGTFWVFLEAFESWICPQTPQLLGYEVDFHFLTGLTWLDISGSYVDVISDSDSILPALPSLQYLNAKGAAWGWWLAKSFDRLQGLVAFSFVDNILSEAGIPEEVRSLTKLKGLDLSGNSFQGRIPSLEGLTQLTQLSLSRNQLSGNVPAAPSLQYLSAAENNLTGFTDSFFQISSLKQVNLSRNQLVGHLPGNVSLKFLQVLDLSWNGLQGQVPSGLGNMTQLDLSNNNLSGHIPQDMSSGRGGLVDLSGNELSGSIPATLLSGPAYLNLSRNSLVGTLPQALSGYFIGPQVDLSDNQLQGPLPSSFSNSNPRQLWLQNNRFSGDFILFLTQAPPYIGYNFMAKSIRVQGNRFTGDVTNLLEIGIVGLFSELTVLDLSHNRFTMTSSKAFPDPLQTLLEQLCVNGSPMEELRLAGSDLMGQPFPDSFTCSRSEGRPDPLPSLQVLDLASCNLSGTVPEFAFLNSSMPNLAFLNLSSNRLSGPIPAKLPVTLTVLDLGNNNLVSEGWMSPDLFTGLRNLVHFNASNNNLSGPIPDTFPPTLRILDLSHNNMAGAIPGNVFFGLTDLEYINLSGNNLSGPIPEGQRLAVFNKSSFAGNPGLCGGPLPRCIPPQAPPTQSGGRINVLVLVTVVVAAVLVCTGSCLLLAWIWRVYSKKHQQDADLIATLLERETVTVMPLRQLRRATSNFSEAAQIGEGGFGTVYNGKLADGTAVAIKKGKREGSPEYKQQFLNEVRTLSGVSHRHLVKLLGCSMEDKTALLVFEFVPNGTLLEHLQGKRQGFSPLSWRQRVLIGLQTSDALSYLHSAADPPIFHRDVKSSNILLDDDLNAKVADFGISKLAPNKESTHVSTVAIQGTMGYIDPEYYVSFQLTPKSDVYSFGVVLLELISAKLAVDFKRGHDEASLANLAFSATNKGNWDFKRGHDEASLANLAFSARDKGNWEGLIDPVLADTYSSANGKESTDSVGALAVRCLAFKSRERPDMREVWKVLQAVWLHWGSDAPDYDRHDPQPQHVDCDVCDYSQQSYQSSQFSTFTISGPEIEMSSLLSTL